MDDNQPRPSFFERLISQLSGEPDSAENVVSLLRQVHEQEVFGADMPFRLEKVLDFTGLEVRDAIIIRSQINVIKENDGIDRIMAYIIEISHSHFPAISGDKDEVSGILHARDLLRFMANPEQFNLRDILHPAVSMPEGKSPNSLLKELREQRNHMVTVIDEYGSVPDLVTSEDIIKQIVDDIGDESDEDESVDNIHAISAERWRINTVTEIEDINAFFGTDYSDEEVDTIGGLVVQELGRLPMCGKKVVVGPLQFAVAHTDRRRLHTLVAVRMREGSQPRQTRPANRFADCLRR